MRDFTIEVYRRLLAAMQTQGFLFQTYFATIIKPTAKGIILRQDVDDLKQNSLAFAKIQHNLGILGTYYFRVIPKVYDVQVIKQIAAMGHEIGYHYENMDTCRGNVDKAYDAFCRNLEAFRKIVPIATICMHGSPMSKFDNRDIWKKYDYRQLGLVGEPYVDLDFSKTAYFTDTGRRWDGEEVSIRDKITVGGQGKNSDFPNYQCRTTFEIIRLIQKGEFPAPAMMTFHPQRWHDASVPWTQELVAQNVKNLGKKYWIYRSEQAYSSKTYQSKIQVKGQGAKKIIIYLGHPAQYHFFKNIVNNLKKNNNIRYLIKTKDVLEELLINDRIDFKNILPEGRKSDRSGIIFGLVKRELNVINEVLHFKPDLMIGSDPSIAHIGKMFKIPVLTVLEDDAHVVKDLAEITFPFSSHIIAPSSCDCGRWNFKKISYAGYMKLAYLHPNCFDCGQIAPEGTALIRLSSLNAFHDIGIRGFDEEVLNKMIEKLAGKYRILISAEGELSPIYHKYLLKISPNDLHKVLSKSSILISDSQSMTMEAAMLGVPSIRYSDFAGRIGVLEELEHTYKLTYGIKPGEPLKVLQKIDEILNISNLHKEFQRRRRLMLNDKIDVTRFFTWLIQNYPRSISELKSHPEMQYQFK